METPEFGRHLRDDLVQYGEALAAGLAQADYGPDGERLEHSAIATAALAHDHELLETVASLWVSLGWRILRRPDSGLGALGNAINYFDSVVRERKRGITPETRGWALLGAAVTYARMPVAEPARVRPVLLRRLRAATRLAETGLTEQLVASVVSAWGQVLTGGHRHVTTEADWEAVRSLAPATAGLPPELAAGVAFGRAAAETLAGNTDAGGRLFRKAARFARKGNDPIRVALALMEAGNVRALQGDTRTSVRLHRQAASVFRSAGQFRAAQEAERTVGALEVREDRFRPAAAAFERSIAAGESALESATLANEAEQVTAWLAMAQHARAYCLVRVGKSGAAAVAADQARARGLRGISILGSPGFAHVARVAPILADQTGQ